MIVERPMVEFLIKLLLVARSKLKSRARLEAENIVLRQQVIVLSRKASVAATAPEHRSADLGLDVPTVPLDSECDHGDQARDRDPLASTRLSGLLALEVPPAWWPPEIDREIRDLFDG